MVIDVISAEMYMMKNLGKLFKDCFQSYINKNMNAHFCKY